MIFRYLVFEDEKKNRRVAAWSEETVTHADVIRQNKLNETALYGGHILYDMQEKKWVLHLNLDFRNPLADDTLTKEERAFVTDWLDEHCGQNEGLKRRVKAPSREEVMRNIKILRAWVNEK